MERVALWVIQQQAQAVKLSELFALLTVLISSTFPVSYFRTTRKYLISDRDVRMNNLQGFADNLELMS